MKSSSFLAAIPFLFLPAVAGADVNARPIADAALDGTNSATGKRITKAFFFVGPYMVRYDWGKDRVDDGFPQTIAGNTYDDAGWTEGIQAANSVFGQSDSFLFRRGQFMIYDWNKDKHPHEIKTSAHFPDGVDSVVHGLGAEYNFDYFFLGAQYLKFDRRTRGIDPNAQDIAGRFKLTRVDSAVNGAGNFVGFAYLFQGDQYVKYDWAAGAVVGGKIKPVQKNFPGLAELTDVAHGLRMTRDWYDVALARIEADLLAAAENKPSPNAQVAGLLASKFMIVTVEQRNLYLRGVRARIAAARDRARKPDGAFRFRTDAEAAKESFPDRAIYADAHGSVTVTERFHALPASCQASQTVGALLELGGMYVPDTSGTTIGERVLDASLTAGLVTELAGAKIDGPCRR